MKVIQESFIDMTEERKRKQAERKKRAEWYKAFQARSDALSQDGTTSAGKCGEMLFCDYCKDCGEKNPCAKAFRVWIRKAKITVNFYDLKSIDNFF